MLVIEGQRYENEFAAKTEVIEEFCALRSIPFARIDTSSSYNPENGYSLGTNGVTNNKINNNNSHNEAKDNNIKSDSSTSKTNMTGEKRIFGQERSNSESQCSVQKSWYKRSCHSFELRFRSGRDRIALATTSRLIAEPSAVQNCL